MGLGCRVVYVVDGPTPWFGLDIYDVVARLRSDETPIWPPGAEKTAPEILVEICKRALHPDPLQRHANGGELATAIADWLEGAQRRERAMELVHQADQLQTGREGLKAEQAEARERERIRFLHAALTQDPRLPEAHSRLTDYYLGLHKASEAKGATQEARRWEDLIRVHDDGRNADYLDGEGRVTLVTEPEGARLTLCRLEYGPDGPEEIDLEDLGSARSETDDCRWVLTSFGSKPMAITRRDTRCLWLDKGAGRGFVRAILRPHRSLCFHWERSKRMNATFPPVGSLAGPITRFSMRRFPVVGIGATGWW